ncbi:MAG: hypothetical protein JWM98_975 [Thermoleophilia bacterium]|nr:hypothetical protein [Thermoleophilia bacterium]
MARHASDGAPDRVKAIPLWAKLLGAIGVVAAACVGLTFVPTGQVAYAPNAPISLTGKIAVDGHLTEPLVGELFLVGVTERRVNLLQRMLLDVADPNVDFGPEPDDAPAGGPAKGDVDAMSEAKQVAAGVAFDLYDPGSVQWSGTGATVAEVGAGTPAAAALRRGDIIVRIDGASGNRVDTSVEASRLINAHPPGSIVTIGLQRAGDPMQVHIRTVAPEPGDAEHASRIGVALSTIGLRIGLPRNVSIDSGEVVGPSAGLAFALYLYDSLKIPVDLLRGRRVVVSGALAPDGQVLAVGRVRQKAIAAQAAHRDVLIVPRANAAEARDAVKDACGDGSCIRVVPVRSIADAVSALRLTDAQLDARIAATADEVPSKAPAG